VAGSSNNSLHSPNGIAITTDDILCIADWVNNRVVMVNLSSLAVIRILGSVQGSGAYQFYSPDDVFIIDTSLYILDIGNYRIQKWSINGTNPSTIPGNGTFASSYFMFIDKNNNTYVSLFQNHKVIRFAPNSATFTTVAGTGTAGTASNQFNNPYGVFLDNNLTMYVSDHLNNRIQKWLFGASSGSTVAGNGMAGSSLAQLYNPSGIVVDQNGYMYIADAGNNRIVRWAPNASSGVCIVGCTGTWGTNANQFNYPGYMAFDSNGSLYVSDIDNNRVQKFQSLNNQSKNSIVC
jgi:streptogramin lyase